MPTTLRTSLIAILITFMASPLQASAASVVVDIPDSYATVTAGERLYFQINFLIPENTRRRDFRVEYRIWEGETSLASAAFLKAVETQASFTDYTVVPESAKSGMHTLEVDIYDDTGALVAQKAYRSFQVEAKSNWMSIYFYVLLGAILLVGVFVAFEVRRVLRALMRGRG